ncbi:MAG: DUF1178 family protein [Desulfobacteraceae bacterium]
MIVFDLECINNHAFEGWFEDSGAFETQHEQGLITCPVCGTASVTRKLSPVAVRTAVVTESDSRNRARKEALLELGEKLSDFVEKNFDDVGPDFTREALKMHYGASEYRNIRGTTTKEEDKLLEKEAVPVFKFPSLKKPDNDDLN